MTLVQRKQLYNLIDTLPDSTLVEVQSWLQSFSHRHRSNGGTSTPFVPVALGGLWKDVLIDDEDIAAVRRDMTEDFLKGLE
jgi:hypothetical protein